MKENHQVVVRGGRQSTLPHELALVFSRRYRSFRRISVPFRVSSEHARADSKRRKLHWRCRPSYGTWGFQTGTGLVNSKYRCLTPQPVTPLPAQACERWGGKAGNQFDRRAVNTKGSKSTTGSAHLATTGTMSLACTGECESTTATPYMPMMSPSGMWRYRAPCYAALAICARPSPPC